MDEVSAFAEIRRTYMNKKILLLGSGELGKEFVIAAQRLGQTIIAVTHDDEFAEKSDRILELSDGELVGQF